MVNKRQKPSDHVPSTSAEQIALGDAAWAAMELDDTDPATHVPFPRLVPAPLPAGPLHVGALAVPVHYRWKAEQARRDAAAMVTDTSFASRLLAGQLLDWHMQIWPSARHGRSLPDYVLDAIALALDLTTALRMRNEGDEARRLRAAGATIAGIAKAVGRSTRRAPDLLDVDPAPVWKSPQEAMAWIGVVVERGNFSGENRLIVLDALRWFAEHRIAEMDEGDPWRRWQWLKTLWFVALRALGLANEHGLTADTIAAISQGFARPDSFDAAAILVAEARAKYPHDRWFAGVDPLPLNTIAKAVPVDRQTLRRWTDEPRIPFESAQPWWIIAILGLLGSGPFAASVAAVGLEGVNRWRRVSDASPWERRTREQLSMARFNGRNSRPAPTD